jgi:pimeloyl-ACP methyl ester carboxylesterase
MAQTRIVRTRGADLTVEVRDGASPVVLVHGFGGSLASWDRLCALLPPDRGCIRYDLRGFGASTALDDAPFHHADDLLDLLDSLGIARCDLVGVSMGGAIALNFALDRPGRLRSLALLSPGLTAWEWSAEWMARWRPIVAAARAGDIDGARALWLAHPLFAPALEGPAAAALRDEVSRFSGREWVRDRQSPALPDLDRLHTLACPALLLTGGRDVAEFRLIADLIASGAPAVERRDCAGAGHLVHLEAPAWCAGHLEAFWQAGPPG